MRANISDELMDAIEERIYLDIELHIFNNRLQKAINENNGTLITYFEKLVKQANNLRKEVNDLLKKNGIKIFDPENIDDMFVRYHYSQKILGGYKEGYQQFWKAAIKLKLNKRMKTKWR